MSTNEPMAQERLNEIQGRLDAATKGPWSIDSDDSTYVIHPEKGGWDGLLIAQVADQDGALFPVEHNGALIAHAPDDLADLLAEVERLRDELAKAREVTDEKVERAARAAYGPNAWDKLDLRDPMTAVQRSAFMAQIRTALEAFTQGVMHGAE